MKIWGISLIALGAIVALVALTLMPSTVSTEEMTTLPYTGSVIGSGRYTETYNMPRAQLRELVFHSGGFVFLAGVLLFVGGALEELFKTAVGTGMRPLAEVSGDSSSTSEDPVPMARPSSSPAVLPPISDEALEAEALRNKEMMAWVFGTILVVSMLVFGLTQLYGPK
ncbi:hypothetical protein FIM10_04135 [Sphingomonadales bacterium 56]|uniref:hypothetical protein n=1 Tax=unclassified Sphingobium TaxID=2611147 RepID=UPI0019192725|nr:MULTISPECIES: hypothetical protein [unclassified Sphingobium]MBY2927865.1 hypothetical protein [Sphingomonadales bacterium 56]MBY2957965.1 hypothetical protein [Sphingomonadales bacterium 58]CAD7336096.1 hypothetical protein SPHS6_00839 [Sphingobium sp. S6]CAD7336161.1 hypothetical protein SPHS8_00880 [Sphingobium sp. S8]